MTFWYRFLWYVARIGLFFWHPVFRVFGRELVPKGACILCANHSGAADPIWILLGLNAPRMIRIMAKQELRRAPVIGWLMERFRIIFVRRGAHDVAAYDACVSALRDEKDRLLVFIEGTRCNGSKHVRAKTGAVRMALETGVPLVPVFVTRNKTPFCPVEVRFGAPYTLAQEPDADHARCQQLADDALRKIYELGGDSYADQIGQNSGLLLRS